MAARTRQWKSAKVARRARNSPHLPMTARAAGSSISANHFPGKQMKGKPNKRKDGKLNVKVAVVTGESKGIGAGIAKEFASEGASVVVNYASAKQDADRVVD